MANKLHQKIDFGVTLLLNEHEDICNLKHRSQQPSIHGDKFWGSSYLLMDYLNQNPIDLDSNVLELGCGWGLGGIFCAKTFKANVTAIDADPEVFPYLECHAKHNDVMINTHSCYFSEITAEDLEAFDVIIAADICFWDELAEEVLELIEKACDAGVKRILISDPERSPFLELAEHCMEEFYAELLPWSIKKPSPTHGAILVIENA